MSEIPADIMKAAEEALDNLLCNCKESCGSYEAVRQASITDIAKAILAEREACADRAERKSKAGRDWVPDSLFANLRREIAASIRGGAA